MPSAYPSALHYTRYPSPNRNPNIPYHRHYVYNHAKPYHTPCKTAPFPIHHAKAYPAPRENIPHAVQNRAITHQTTQLRTYHTPCKPVQHTAQNRTTHHTKACHVSLKPVSGTSHRPLKKNRRHQVHIIYQSSHQTTHRKKTKHFFWG